VLPTYSGPLVQPKHTLITTDLEEENTDESSATTEMKLELLDRLPSKKREIITLLCLLVTALFASGGGFGFGKLRNALLKLKEPDQANAISYHSTIVSYCFLFTFAVSGLSFQYMGIYFVCAWKALKITLSKF